MPWEATEVDRLTLPEEGPSGSSAVCVGDDAAYHFFQQLYALSDSATEEALYGIASLRQCAMLSLLEAIPDETTMMGFHHIGTPWLSGDAAVCGECGHVRRGLLLRHDTVDATTIHAPTSIKNSTCTREPEMHQVNKGNQWFFGLKALATSSFAESDLPQIPGHL